jgi:hypothetical protein
MAERRARRWRFGFNRKKEVRMTQTDTQASERFTLTGHISRPRVEIGTRHIHINYQDAFTFDVGEFGREEIELALHDSEIFSALLRNHPAEMAEVMNEVLAGHTETAVRLAARIGLTEEAFHRRGGGPLIWGAIAFCAGVIFAAAAFSGSDSKKQKSDE